ncbi:hypothetical protein CFOL_v3_23984 [Cephalotus follicularis]|uniref:DUF7086 domain-containing protein n=1 Tax=Cephalotus follicularis TaxID=3775 RepID=A0A1Q3CK90_CEPFO|nr:hypothetical protein CFOL_v3_23984 [Cephalotus follicularis]
MKPNDQEINRKRKNTQDYKIPNKLQELEDEDRLVTLALSFYPPKKPSQPHEPPLPIAQSPPPPQQQQQVPQSLPMQPLLPQNPIQHPLQLSPSHPLYIPPFVPEPMVPRIPLTYRPESEMGPPRPRARRNPTQGPRDGKSDVVPAPYPWATAQRATVHSLNYMVSKQIFTITGDVQCKRCEKPYVMEYDLRDKFVEVGSFVAEHRSIMHDRAPSVWMNPVLPTCKFCEHENSVKPVIAEKKKAINWLFLLLGQMLGCCTLEQLKYFCKHTKNHRTGAKDRVLYLTYLGLCKQLDPNGPFDRC